MINNRRAINRQGINIPYIARLTVFLVMLVLSIFFLVSSADETKTDEKVTETTTKTTTKTIKTITNEVSGGLWGKSWQGSGVRLKVMRLLSKIKINVRVTVRVNGKIQVSYKPLNYTRVIIKDAYTGKSVADAITDDKGELQESAVNKVGIGRFSIRPVTVYPAEPYFYASTFILDEKDIDKEMDITMDFSGVAYNALTGKPINGADIMLKNENASIVQGSFDHYSGNAQNPKATGSQVAGGTEPDNKPKFDLFDGEFQFKNPGLVLKAQGLETEEVGTLTLAENKKYYVTVDFKTNPKLKDKYFEVTKAEGEWAEYEDPYKGQLFTLAANQPIGMQVALVPLTALKVTKTSNKNRAEVGDIITYMVKIENTTDDPTHPDKPVELYDTAPVGLKFLPGTARLNGHLITPLQDNNTLKFTIGQLQRKGDPNKQDIAYIVYMATLATSVTPGRTYKNTAYAVIDTLKVSNDSSVSIRSMPSAFADRAPIIGKVFIDNNKNGWQDAEEQGVGGVRLVMEDGTIVTTDQTGKYSIPDVTPGQHVLKLDVNSLPAGVEPLSEISRFVQVSAGLIVKQNFTLQGELKSQPVPVKVEPSRTEIPPEKVDTYPESSPLATP